MRRVILMICAIAILSPQSYARDACYDRMNALTTKLMDDVEELATLHDGSYNSSLLLASANTTLILVGNAEDIFYFRRSLSKDQASLGNARATAKLGLISKLLASEKKKFELTNTHNESVNIAVAAKALRTHSREAIEVVEACRNGSPQ